jgi:outer membrane lipoprotein carrier protein
VKLRYIAVLALAFRTALGAQAPAVPADSIARDLQAKYDRVTDFSADFVHTYRGGVLKQQATERGRLLVKKPGKMRWEYTAPEKKLFVSDGRKIYSYIPQDRQVVVSTMPQDDQAPTPALFLTGKGNITRDFTVAYDKVADAPPGSVALKLTPRKREPEYESLTLVVDPKSLGLRMLIAMDTQGGRSAFTFANLKENVGLPDNQFVFQMPRNVDVVTDAGGR